jgi:hypothetical protein
MGTTLSDFLGRGVDLVPRACPYPQMITPENSYDLERGSEGEVANSTSSVLLEKLIVSKIFFIIITQYIAICPRTFSNRV